LYANASPINAPAILKIAVAGDNAVHRREVVLRVAQREAAPAVSVGASARATFSRRSRTP